MKRAPDTTFLWYLADPRQPRLVGTLRLVLGNRSVSLRYGADWLAHGFPISEDLPLVDIEHAPAVRDEVVGAVEDARPDRWGERVIEAIEKPTRRSLRDSTPPIPPTAAPTPGTAATGNFTDAAGYFNERGEFVCLRWRCDPQDQCRPPRLASDYMPAATDPRNPPAGCVCDDPRFRLPNGPTPPSLDDFLEAGAQAYGDYRRGPPRFPGR